MGSKGPNGEKLPMNKNHWTEAQKAYYSQNLMAGALRLKGIVPGQTGVQQAASTPVRNSVTSEVSQGNAANAGFGSGRIQPNQRRTLLGTLDASGISGKKTLLGQ